ncbi:phosphoenolpyruvate synthase [Vibrio sp. SCSIO 43135]|uniref:putative PEP-binding protein n=1 Tax=Vibrio sp. SCSIO 43135 TaxID=2819096 RepID=UPI00207573F3|nr:putative PEP-binding protein [Vibrio sp. SCSIO 43135]USD42463.1 phosphoenolpyruvate synthase [Vibrio sp. SCSIO 43135]
MNLDNNNRLHPELILGDSIPSSEQEMAGPHVYISIADLIAEKVFYHPSISQVQDSLSAIEASSLEAILGGNDVAEHFVSVLVAELSASIQPSHQAVRVCLSNTDSAGFSALIGGKVESDEVNPALGSRGVIRYASEAYNPAFALECQVIKVLREQGINVEVVVPFVRTLADAATIIDKLAEQGLPRGLNGLRVLFSVDVPSSALLAERLLHYFDGVVINLDNLAQFTLGIDRTSAELEQSFDPENESVIQLLDITVSAAAHAKKPSLVVSHGLESSPKVQEYLLEHRNVAAVTGA